MQSSNDSKSNTSSVEVKASNLCRLSEAASFSIETIPNSEKLKIRFTYKDPVTINGQKKHEHLMLVTFPQNSQPIEDPMNYNEKDKCWSVEIERDQNAGEQFNITTAKERGKKENQSATVLQDGYISFKNGILQPVNRVIDGSPEGKLETFLLTIDGKIQKPKEIDEKKLKDGERYIKIYTPHGYDSNTEKKPPYDLQVTLDGGQYLDIMQMNVVLDNLISKNEIEPTVVVFISPHSGPPDKEKKGFVPVMPIGYSLSMRLKEYSCNPDFTDILANLPNTLRDEQFNISDDPKRTTIWGSVEGHYKLLIRGYSILMFTEM